MDYLDEIVENSNTWTRPSLMDSTDRTKTNTTTSSESVFKLREDDNMSAKISMLNKEIEALKMKGSKSVSVTFGEDPMEDKHEEVKAVTILRSGKEIDKSAPLITKESKESKETPIKEEKVETESLGLDDIEQCPIPPPFPQALKLPRKLDTTSEILEHLHQVKINFPLLHVIKQVLAYAKVIKDLSTIKRKHHVKKTAFLTEQVSAIIQHKTSPKYKDPGCPTISCTIGDYIVEHALLDLGASVNLIPFSLADCSVTEPRRIVEDVLVKIEHFYYPVDFIVLDYQPVLHPNVHTPIILGRPFLATANALINCRNGRM
ncbi:hypothetical protein ACB092_04G081200 [Castanea dentata]